MADGCFVPFLYEFFVFNGVIFLSSTEAILLCAAVEAAAAATNFFSFSFETFFSQHQLWAIVCELLNGC